MKTAHRLLAFCILIVLFVSCQKDQLPQLAEQSDNGNPYGHLYKTGQLSEPISFGELADITFLGSEQIDGNTMFSYQVVSGTKSSLSHWNLLILPAETGHGIEEVVIVECSELFEQGKDGSLKKYNKDLADLNWLKFDQGYSDGEIRTVSFTLEGIWYEGDVDGIAKGGKEYEEAIITGPVQFKPWKCGDPLIDERDGQSYNTVLIGNQCWMADNLAYLPEVSPSSEESDNDPFYYVYDYEGTNVTSAKETFSYGTYGVLYNFSAALSACPAGWHLSSDPEWTELTEYLTNNGYGYEGSGDDIAKSLASTSGWRSLDNPGVVGYDQASNNSSGFGAPPSGYRHFNGYPHGLTQVAFFWTSSEDRWLSGYFLFRGLHYYTGVVYRTKTKWSFGFSVRCIKD